MTDAPAPTLDYRAKKASKRDKRNPFFWRAARYLAPYKRIVVLSILAAFFAGGVFAGGLTAVLPVLQTLLNGDTPQTWADRMVAEKRWDIDLADDPTTLRLNKFHDDDSTPDGQTLRSSVFHSECGRALYLPVRKPQPLRRHPQRKKLSLLADASSRRDYEGDRDHSRDDSRRCPPSPPPPPPRHVRPAVGPRLGRRVPDGRHLAPLRARQRRAVLPGVPQRQGRRAGGKRPAPRLVRPRPARADELLRQERHRRRHQPHRQRRRTAPAGLRHAARPRRPAAGDGAGRVLRRALRRLAVDPLRRRVRAVHGRACFQKFGKKMRRASKRSLANNAEVLGQIEATLSGIRVVKANVAERHESNRLGRILDGLVRYQLKLVKYDAFSTPVMETAAVLAIGVIATVMVYFVRTQGSLSVSGGVLIFGCLAQMADSFRRVSKLNILLQKANAAAERIFETVDLPSEADDRRTQSRKERKGDAKAETELVSEGRASDARPSEDNGIANLTSSDGQTPSADPAFASPLRSSRLCVLRPLAREISFQNVTFRYNDDQPPAVEDVSLTIQKGESVAVVGRNGSGKTTLLSLLPRFFEPEAGRILIDDTDVRDVALSSLRGQISVVTQEAVVFPGTIAENIAYANPDAPRDAIVDGRPTGLRPRLHHRQARRIRLPPHRPRRTAQRRAAPAPQHRPRHPPRLPHPHPRRGHQPGRRRVRTPDPAGIGPPHARPDDVRHRPPLQHHPRLRPHRPHGTRPPRRRRHARGTARHQRAVPRPLRTASSSASDPRSADH